MNIKNNKNCKITINDNEANKFKINIKTADEMFLELGYIKEDNDYCEAFFINKDNSVFIYFYKNKTILIADGYFEAVELDLQELQAINKKCQELGWI